MSDDQGDAASTQVLHDLQATVEELARRMGAGFREDLAQIRAIATSIAERDVTDDLRALRAEVAALAERDTSRPLAEELAAVRAELSRLAPADAVAGVRADLAPVQAALDRIAARLDDDAGRTQVLARFQALESKLDALAGGDGRDELAARVDQLAARLDALATADQVGRMAGDLRAHLVDALGGLDGDTVLAELAGMRAQLGTERGSIVEQLQDHLADVASGEVVGALWDEVRGLRETVDGVAAASVAPAADEGGAGTADLLDAIETLRGEVEGIGAAVAGSAEPQADPAVAGMRDDVQALVDEVRALSDAVASVEREVLLRPPTAERDEHPADADPSPLLGQLTDELATLRAELAEGLVVEPSDALSASLDALRVEVDSLHAALGDVRAQATAPAAAAPGPSADALATLFDELATIRAGVDDVRDRLDEEPAPAPEAEPLAAGTPPAELEVLVDQVAALRDLVSSEVDGLRQAVVAAADRAEEASRQRVADEAPAPAAAPTSAALDPSVVEDLKDEIRAAGAIGDQVVDALRDELKALRRRIAVKASEKVLDEDQLRQIADAVAARLARD